MTDISYAQAVRQVLESADRPLTIREIVDRVEEIRPVTSKNPRSTIRNAMNQTLLATTLGGRPAHYTWWPHHLPESVFRQPLAASDLEAGSLVLIGEVKLALWPDFFEGPRRHRGDVTFEFATGDVITAQIQHLEAGRAMWGIPPNPALAEWYRLVGARNEDELIVRILDAEEHRYGLALVRRAERDEAGIASRNQALADVAEHVVLQGRDNMPDFHLVPRLIGHDVYRDPLPPDPWPQVLRADLRFVVRERRSVYLTSRVVDDLEEDGEIPPDPAAYPRPSGARDKAKTEADRRAWAAYLFDQGMEYRWAGYSVADEAYYQEALRLDPGHADAWVHMGNCRFEEGLVTEALSYYQQAQAAAEERTIGDPDEYPSVFWGDVKSRPFMRALYGQGISLWRLGQVEAARQIFSRMMELNPRDNQGVRILLPDLDEGLSWAESVERQERRAREREERFRRATGRSDRQS
jgi:tetratricopeptide (TPR) repeat protein